MQTNKTGEELAHNEPLIGIFFVCFYGAFALIALVNLLFMRRALPPFTADKSQSSITILIPARNEEANLARLLPALLGPGSEGANPPKIYVFDDESEDQTAEIARQHGAVVLQPAEKLPVGWTGKNRACHELAKAAVADGATEWILFLDADVYPERGFIAGVEAMTQTVSATTCVISGFPRMIPGEGIEPLFLAWVGWILLTSNPYGIVSLTGKGHNRFTNGQFGCWRTNTYTELWPNEMLKDRILEDVLIGRLCANRGIGVEVVNLSRIMAVKMYSHWRETLDGMSKNTYEITGSVIGSIGLAALFMLIGWGWLIAGHLLPIATLLFLLSGLFAALIVRAKPYALPLLPIVLSIGAFTIMRSLVWHKRGKVTWKGRSYGSPNP